MIEQIREKINAHFKELQEIRRHIHANPELSFKEYQTAAFIEKKLLEFGVKDFFRITETGVVALIKGKNPESKCIALRADMDALPIMEANEVSYKSQNPGVMHACGHDVHTTCLLGAARILSDLREYLGGTIKLIFQPGEEKSPGGANLMIQAGVLHNPVPEAVFALHVYPGLPAGTAGFRAGQYMASADEIYISIKGKGGHAALPHQTIDPITIAAQVIVSLQQLVSRKASPLTPSVLSFGKISGGNTTNVIPEEVKLEGTFRTLDESWRKEALHWIKKITVQTCEAMGAEATVEIPEGYPSLFNDPQWTLNAEAWAREYIGASKVHTLDLRMSAEDFSFYTQKIPGCFFRIGTSKEGKEFTASVHNPHFDIDEEAIKTGAGLLTWIAIKCGSGQ